MLVHCGKYAAIILLNMFKYINVLYNLVCLFLLQSMLVAIKKISRSVTVSKPLLMEFKKVEIANCD